MEDYDFFFKVLYYNKLNVCYCDKIVTLINDNVPNSLTKIKVPLNTSEWQTKKFLVDINPFFIGNKYLSNRSAFLVHITHAGFSEKLKIHSNFLSFLFNEVRKKLKNV